MRRLIAAAVTAVALVGSAQAAQQMSAQDRQLLSQLTPQARQEVMSRLGPGQSVREIVETMVLNRLSAMYAEGKVVEVDVITGVATIQYKDGTTKKVPFKVEEIVVRE